ncbi:MAG TPA: N-acetylmuramoyl-L-alanine amidase [bacterium]|nr:N-acetylmuramoyl-L-alanine amidase [bacterium]
MRLLPLVILLSVSLLRAADADNPTLPGIEDIIQKKSVATAKIAGITLYQSEDSVRVVIQPSEKVDFKYDLLAGNGKDRIYIDLKKTTADGFTVPTVTADSFLRAIRLGKRDDGTRIVLDTGKVEKYNVMVMEEPWRVVIDYIGRKQAPPAPSAPALPTPPATGKKGTPPPAVKQPERFVIVLDPGHGGKDSGALRKGILEKDIVLDLARIIRKKAAKEHPDVSVILTRDTDIFLPLEERAVIANKNDGDLFVSLHANAFKDPEVGGLEVYHLNNRSDEYAEKLARVENSMTNDNSFLNTILVDMTMSFYIGDSQKFAESVGLRFGKELKPFNVKLRDWRKGALFYVLVGARMPSLLVEIGYLSNPQERKLLQTKKYLETIADAILDGVQEVRKKHTLAKDRP